jgi:hypothetical protein
LAGLRYNPPSIIFGERSLSHLDVLGGLGIMGVDYDRDGELTKAFEPSLFVWRR